MAEYIASKTYTNDPDGCSGAIEVCIDYRAGDDCFAEISIVEDGEETGILLNDKDVEWLIKALRKAQALYNTTLTTRARLG